MELRMKKKITNLLVVFAICLSILSFGGVKSSAANLADVLYYWKQEFDYNTNTSTNYAYAYKTISYVNGYTYTTTKTKISNWYQEYVLKFVIYEYNRTFSTY